ncbi:uncharacterized protein F4807DRAFT_210504 [Annulohypoxylon truncatum]|uniref:uncharacterized protein n=1 Tax=Annulohypoxylon truncatum TaxID=327061 RepID=UPI002007AD61|nr:uncharacterized protein F4807DRAFT_210504 [Annulohypoxylon truncatum]KAI1206989.1 hypothetical protein F4807DRAFT_210504 [Annulohypoxylon truncatum]
MELPQNATVNKPPEEDQSVQEILRKIDDIVEGTFRMNDVIAQSQGVVAFAGNSVDSQSALLDMFKDVMIAIQRKASKAVHEVEMKLGPNLQLKNSHDIAEASLEDLVGVNPKSQSNQLLGRALLGGKQSYKLRDHISINPSLRLFVDDDTAGLSQANPQDPFVILQPTLRNVWVVQHAYARLQNYKERLIREYQASVDPSLGSSRKFAREYYEDLSLANLPSKNKLGNLLDVKRSPDNQATHDMMIALLFTTLEGDPRFVEAVTEEDVGLNGEDDGSSYLVIPVAEASIKMLYDTYKSLRKATSEQRRAAKDKVFAANLPVDAVDELEKQFNIGGSENSDQTGGGNSKKRRRMLEDE